MQGRRRRRRRRRSSLSARRRQFAAASTSKPSPASFELLRIALEPLFLCAALPRQARRLVECPRGSLPTSRCAKWCANGRNGVRYNCHTSPMVELESSASSCEGASCIPLISMDYNYKKTGDSRVTSSWPPNTEARSNRVSLSFLLYYEQSISATMASNSFSLGSRVKVRGRLPVWHSVD